MTYRRAFTWEMEVQAAVSLADIAAADYWHALMTPPMKEIDATIILRRLGVIAWCPMQTAWKRAGSWRLRQRPTRYPAFVRYILVGVRGDPDWGLLMKTGYIRGVISADAPGTDERRPYRIHPVEVELLAERQRSGGLKASSPPAPEALARGDVAKVIDDESPLLGYRIVVEEVEGAEFDTLVDWFGRKTWTRFRLDQVRKAA